MEVGEENHYHTILERENPHMSVELFTHTHTKFQIYVYLYDPVHPPPQQIRLL